LQALFSDITVPAQALYQYPLKNSGIIKRRSRCSKRPTAATRKPDSWEHGSLNPFEIAINALKAVKGNFEQFVKYMADSVQFKACNLKSKIIARQPEGNAWKQFCLCKGNEG